MKVKIVTGTAQSANNIKRKNKQINNDKKIYIYQRLIITYACRCKQQRKEVMTSQILNLDWLAIFKKKKREMKNVQLPNISTLLQIGEEI